MDDQSWKIKRDLRIELLKIVDQIELLSIVFRDRGVEPELASELNNLQIHVVEMIEHTRGR